MNKTQEKSTRNTFILIGVVIAVIAAYLYFDGKDDVKANPVIAMDSYVTVKDVIYKVDDVKESAEYNGEKTANKFVIVTLSATNNGKKEAEVYSELFYLIDSADREYKGSVTRDMGGSSGYFGYGAAIQPGIKKSGQVAFEVPSDASGFTLAISDSMTNNGGKEAPHITLDRR